MPSPTSTTVPTLRVSVAASNESIDDLMMLVISSERMAMRCLLGSEGAGGELLPEPLEAAADASVDEAIADAHDQATEEALVDVGREGDPAARHLLQSSSQRTDLRVGQLRRAGRGGIRDALAKVIEPAELR